MRLTANLGNFKAPFWGFSIIFIIWLGFSLFFADISWFFGITWAFINGNGDDTNIDVVDKVAQFRMSGVDVSSRVAAVITAVNRQGRSESVTLEGAVERAVGSRAG